MKPDLYTKVVLTFIVVFLGVLVFQNITFVEKAHAINASTAPKQVDVNSQNGVMDVNIVSINGRYIQSSGIDVNISNIKGSSWGTLDVKIKEVDRTIPVEVKNYRDFK